MKILKEKFFHTIDEDGEIDMQGMVLSRSLNRVTVQLFSWLTGFPNGEKTFTELDALNWRFYKTEGEWLNAGDKLGIEFQLAYKQILEDNAA